jgi:alkylation response protein AidB-like acyl-CoA dehydrogenase
MQNARHAEMHSAKPGSAVRTGNQTQPDPGLNPAARLFAEIDALAAQITAGAGSAEAGRRVPADIMTRLGGAGLFRLSVPKSHGGLEVDFPTTLEVIRRLSRLDGSLGWLASVRGASPTFLPLLPRESYDALMADGPDVLLSGIGQPAGRAEAVPGGWRVSGSGPFASGCYDSTLF